MSTFEMVHMTVTALIVATVWCICTTASPITQFNDNSLLQSSSPATYKINVLTSASTTVCKKEFLSVAIDTHAASNNWIGFNFSSIRMQNLAKALSPCDVRFGGIMSDFLIFVPSNATNPQEMLGLDNMSDNFEFSDKEWDTLTTFVKTVGWNFIFDFNVFFRSNGHWNTSNAELLLNYSTARKIPIAAFQLGNEPAHYARLNNVDITGRNLSGDLRILRKLISKYARYRNSLILGPSVTHNPSSMTYLRTFVAAGGTNFTNETDIHHYYMDGRNATVDDFLNITTLNSLKKVFETVLSILKNTSHPHSIRLSETSSTFGGGTPGLTDSYAAGFLWLDKLGISALYGLSRVIRQSFIGGSYELVTAGKFDPTPDFYMSVLFKRLVEGPVFPVTLTPAQEHLRVYANCARRDVFSFPAGAIVVYFLNVGSVDTVLSLEEFPDEDLQVFLLTHGDDTGLTSRSVKLNGHILSMPHNDIPPLLPVHQTGDITVAAHSFGFIAIPQANVPACINYNTTI